MTTKQTPKNPTEETSTLETNIKFIGNVLTEEMEMAERQWRDADKREAQKALVHLSLLREGVAKLKAELAEIKAVIAAGVDATLGIQPRVLELNHEC